MSPDFITTLVIGIIQILLALLSLWQNHIIRGSFNHGETTDSERESD